MTQEKFSVSNVKCGGCVANIQTGLKKLAGVSAVQVDIGSGSVLVDGNPLDRNQLALTLKQLGYPEKNA